MNCRESTQDKQAETVKEIDSGNELSNRNENQALHDHGSLVGTEWERAGERETVSKWLHTLYWTGKMTNRWGFSRRRGSSKVAAGAVDEVGKLSLVCMVSDVRRSKR